MQDSISLVDGRTGTEVKKLDLSSLGYFEDEAKFKKSVEKVARKLEKMLTKDGPFTSRDRWKLARRETFMN